MGLLKNLLAGRSRSGDSSQFPEPDVPAEPSEDPGSASAKRKDLVKVVLRDMMRKHSIPSDWIEIRILSATTRQRRAGMHVQFIVVKGEEQLLTYVHAFQDSYWREIERYDPKARGWLFSIGWQFTGQAKSDNFVLPKFDGWDEDSQDTQPPEEPEPPRKRAARRGEPEDAQDTLPPDHEDEVESDLAALYAIRDAALSEPADLADLPPAQPRPHKPGH